ncbi:hypothetical protein [Mycolicibacterium anyangense]|nr:hypothetical protein [Mycolicibacterium anyangense]
MLIVASSAASTPAVAAASARTTNSAADVVSELQGQGYDVQLNGQLSGGLARCTVTGVHPTLRGPMQPGTAYVDIDCPGDD